MKIKVTFEPQEKGGYTVCLPSLAGCISEGDTMEETKRNIIETVELYLEPNEDELFDYRGLKLPAGGGEKGKVKKSLL